MKKKNIIMLAIIALSITCYSNVHAKTITACESSIKGAIIDSRIPETTSTIITVIRIAVPVLLVIFGMLDLFKGLTAGKEDEIKKGQQTFIKRLIAGALIFFVVIIVQFIVSFAAGSNDGKTIMDCANCFINYSNKNCYLK